MEEALNQTTGNKTDTPIQKISMGLQMAAEFRISSNIWLLVVSFSHVLRLSSLCKNNISKGHIMLSRLWADIKKETVNLGKLWNQLIKDFLVWRIYVYKC